MGPVVHESPFCLLLGIFSSLECCNKKETRSLDISETQFNAKKSIKAWANEKGGENMKKAFKLVAIASAVVIILTVSIVSVAMAAGPNPTPGTCPNPDCTNVCQNSDCTCDGDQLMYQHQNGPQSPKGSAFQYRYNSCQVD